MNDEFDNMGLKETLLKGIYSYGFEKPSEIQKQAIPEILSGKDLIAQAQSGTGKTGTFSIGLLQCTSNEFDYCQGIILSPTRELAEQTYDVITSLGKYTELNIHLSVGGYSVVSEREKLTSSPVHIVVGTPGRILQMIEEKYLNITKMRLLVLDEADEVLKIGFRDQIVKIFKNLPQTSQIAIFSATMPKEAIEVSRKFLENPTHILVKAEELTLEGIKQFFVYVNHENAKLEVLLDIYSKLCVSQAIIFVNSKRKVNILAENLKCKGFTVGLMHSEMSMKERNDVYAKFRKGHVRIVITTDILSRGIDIQGISFVINYDIPKNKEVYIHRIGRSGRYGKKGVAINFVTDEDIKDLRTIEKFYSTEIEQMPDDIENFL